MPIKRPTPPEREPAEGDRVPAARKTAKKTVVNKTCKKSAEKTAKTSSKPPSKRQSAAQRDRNVIARAAKRSGADAAAAASANEMLAPPSDPPTSSASDAAAEPTPSPPKKTRGPSGVTRTAVDRLNDPPPASGLPLVDRVTHAIERELTQIELIVSGSHVKPEQRTEAERRARTLASLARTLAQLRKLRAADDKRAPDDDSIPRDLDELRRALSRRLEQMVAGGAQLPAAGDE